MNLQPYQQRVVDEKDDLDNKTASLVAFLTSDKFMGLDQAERNRLIRQSHIMSLYSQVLGERIEAFPAV